MTDDVPPEDDPDNFNADGEPVCGSRDTGSGDACQYPVDDPADRCHMHPEDGSGPPDGHGSGNPANDGRNQLANDGGPAEGNKNAMSHGLYAAERDPTELFDYWRENHPEIAEMIRRVFWSFMDDAPFDAYTGRFDRENPPVLDVVSQEALEAADGRDTASDDDMAQGPPRQNVAEDAPPIDVQALTGKGLTLFGVCVTKIAAMRAMKVWMTEGLTTERPLTDSDGDVVTGPDGEPYMVEFEQEVNLAISRIRRDNNRVLKDLGVMDDPESQKAEAMGWGEAARDVALRRSGESG